MPLLEVRDLAVAFAGPGGVVRAVRGVSFDVPEGQTVALVGPSGSGKSATALAVLGLLSTARVTGRAVFQGRDLLALPPGDLRAVRGAGVGMVFQDPFSTLHPCYRIGDQVAEVIRIHEGAAHRAAWARAVRLLEHVGIPDAAVRARDYPHQFSGGMLQRAVIAMAIALTPRLLMADEPTSALDVAVQARIIALLKRLQAEHGMALLMITHDLALVSGIADAVVTLRAGRIVEREPAVTYGAPHRPSAAGGDPLVRLEGVVKRFDGVTAVRGVSLEVGRGETLGIVGESGSGKTTLVRCLTRLTDVSEGRVVLDGVDITRLDQAALRPFRRRMQLVFQDPLGSLNPRHKVGAIIGEPLLIHGLGGQAERARRVRALMELVRLDAGLGDRYPAELSGGQRQRVAIARALAVEPELLVLDEPVSALDVATRAQILTLLAELRERLGLTCVFVAHDLAVVRHVSDRIAVMYRGEIVETTSSGGGTQGV